MPNQTGGGSIGQSLRYLDPQAPEQSANAGSDLLIQRGLIARPAIGGGSLATPSHRRGCGTRKRKGGFYPSVMTGVASNGMLLVPAAAFAARRLLSGKTRKGGGVKGNAWKAQKEEAKAILAEIGNPSAKNVLAYAAARRRGNQTAEAFLNQYRQAKVGKAEQFSAKRLAKVAAKEARVAETEALKAAKEETRRLKKAAKEAEKLAAKAIRDETRKLKKVMKPKAKAAEKPKTPVSNGERPPTELQLRRAAEANAAAAAAAAKANKKRESQSAWFSLINQAQKQLEGEGKASRKNAMRLASLIKKGENTSGFLTNFKARTQKVKTPEKPKTPPSTIEVPVTLAAKAKKPQSNASKAYFTALKTARETLSEVGAPTGPNMAKFASMTMKGQNTSAWLENFKSRRPKTLATAKKPRTAKAAAKKALTAVKESNENNMQGYEEDFESEPTVE
jgi:hypothetical protein